MSKLNYKITKKPMIIKLNDLTAERYNSKSGQYSYRMPLGPYKIAYRNKQQLIIYLNGYKTPLLKKGYPKISRTEIIDMLTNYKSQPWFWKYKIALKRLNRGE